MMLSRKKLQVKVAAVSLQKITGHMLAINDRGLRIGEDHGRAKLSDHEVELMRALHEEFPVGHPEHIGYRRLAAKFDCTKTLARKICNYLLRAQHTAKFKRR